MNNQMMKIMNINPKIMNNQLMTNFLMDDTAMKIKYIIDPYEQKIIKLEKIIREKDFEIVVLKQKLYSYKNNKINLNMNMNNQINMNNQMNINNQMNMNNQINMNMNWLDQYNMNNNMNMNFIPPNLNNQNMNNMIKGTEDDTLKQINFIFVYKKISFNELCTYDEKIQEVIKRFCNKLGLNYKKYLKFIFNAKRLNPDITVAEAGITNMSKIFVIETKGIKGAPDKNNSDNDNEENPFRIKFKEKDGTTKVIFVNQEHSIGAAIKKYLIQTERPELIHRLSEQISLMEFIFQGKRIDINDRTKVKEFFYN